MRTGRPGRSTRRASRRRARRSGTSWKTNDATTRSNDSSANGQPRRHRPRASSSRSRWSAAAPGVAARPRRLVEHARRRVEPTTLGRVGQRRTARQGQHAGARADVQDARVAAGRRRRRVVRAAASAVGARTGAHQRPSDRPRRRSARRCRHSPILPQTRSGDATRDRTPRSPTPAALDVRRPVRASLGYHRGMRLPFDPPLEPMLAKPSDGAARRRGLALRAEVGRLSGASSSATATRS